VRTRVSRLVLEYGSTAKPAGSKTCFTTFLRLALTEGAVESKGVVAQVDFNINPGFNKPTSSLRETNSQKLGFAFEYAMARPYPCIMTIHFKKELCLPKVIVNFKVQEEAHVARRIIVEFLKQAPRNGSGDAGGRPGGYGICRQKEAVVFDADPPRSGWVHCRGAQEQGSQIEYLTTATAQGLHEHLPFLPGIAPGNRPQGRGRGRRAESQGRRRRG